MCYKGSCFISKKARLAKKDIKVFKFAIEAPSGKVVPYFFSNRSITCYEEGKEYTSKIYYFYGINNNLVIEEGLHSYNKKLCWYKRNSGSYYIDIHSLFISPDMYFDIREGVKLLKLDCHIPKGATYYINLSGEMVSDRLVIDKIIKI